MLFVQIANNEVVAVTDKTSHGEGWQSRWDWKDLDTAQQIAEGATKLTGRLHIGIDNGPCVSPRFDIMEAPAVGDEVSYAFNGDYYPDGVITSVTKGSLKVVRTSTGSTYYRRRNTGNWKKAGGTWSLVPGHRTDKNPSF